MLHDKKSKVSTKPRTTEISYLTSQWKGRSGAQTTDVPQQGIVYGEMQVHKVL